MPTFSWIASLTTHNLERGGGFRTPGSQLCRELSSALSARSASYWLRAWGSANRATIGWTAAATSRRGLGSPWLVITDGAMEAVWPQAGCGRCTVHKLRNVLAKLPKRHPELPPAGQVRVLIGELERRYPSAAVCLAEDLPAVCASACATCRACASDSARAA